MARNKYFAKKTEIDGIKFDSLKEGRRYQELLILQRAGHISDLECHPFFDLKVDGFLICKYVADFAYIEDGKRVIQDVKGCKNSGAWRIFRIKQKLMKAIHDIDVVVV